jgi:hypothetical protein
MLDIGKPAGAQASAEDWASASRRGKWNFRGFAPAIIIGPRPFSEWLAQAQITDDPEGDLIGDLRSETPPTFASAAELRRYLRDRRACRECLAVAPKVWRRYRGGSA